ncbi:hypothetical protein EDD15DRAFT_2523282 [Pisolithus albus]|nr:hypothetical protein EDD15DRAFT_2523282 [Pisolithus albus]
MLLCLLQPRDRVLGFPNILEKSCSTVKLRRNLGIMWTLVPPLSHATEVQFKIKRFRVLSTDVERCAAMTVSSAVLACAVSTSKSFGRSQLVYLTFIQLVISGSFK